LHKNIIYTVKKKIKEIIKKSDRRDIVWVVELKT